MDSITKPMIKRILTDLIQTPDNVDAAVIKLQWLFRNPLSLETHVNKAGQFLSADGDKEIMEMIKAIQKQSQIDETVLIDWVDGVSVWEKVELEFTCKEFLELCDYDSTQQELRDEHKRTKDEPFEEWSTVELFDFLQNNFVLDPDVSFGYWKHAREKMIEMAYDYIH